MFKNIIVAFISMIFLSCIKVDSMPIKASIGKDLHDREVSIITRESPDFEAGTVGKLVAGGFLIGGVMAKSEGDYIIKANLITDPAIKIREQLKIALEQKYGTKNSTTTISTNTVDIQQICAANPNADLILDVRTERWLFVYLPMNWSRYRVIYSASLRLIDNRLKTVIAEGTSVSVSDKTQDAPTKEELLANKAERLKLELVKATEFCVNDFKSRILAI